MKLFKRHEIYDIDQSVIGVTQSLKSVVTEVGIALGHWFLENVDISKKILILIGPGNNGKDGLALTDFLKSKSYDVTTSVSSPAFSTYDVIVDCLFGIGLNKNIEGDFKNWIEESNRSHALKVAIDIPSGVNCDTGETFAPFFQADHTLAVAAHKQGFYLSPGLEACGEIHLIEVDSLKTAVATNPATCSSLNDFSFEAYQATSHDHKYTRGKVCVVLSEDFPGAALMAAHAAQKAGAGYVLVLCPESLLKTCQVQHPDLVFLGYKNSDELSYLVREEKYQTLVLGSGWTQIPNNFDLQPRNNAKLILDGGFLSSQLFPLLDKIDTSKIVLTPHLGELKRLTGLEQSKWEMVQDLTKKFDGTIVAKGYDTIIQQKDLSVITTWNSPALATAGTGDILCGILGSFTAKEDQVFIAAQKAVHLHRLLAKKNPVSASPDFLLNQIEKIINS